MLTDTQVKKFQDIYKDVFGKKISREDAFKSGTELICLVKMISSPITKNQNLKSDKINHNN